jgi:ABC-type dipeptide/oligopeptide/nickel transport system permease subunit
MRFRTAKSVLRQPTGAIGAVIVVVVLFVAFVGPYLARYSPTETLGPPNAPAGGAFLLGTDFLGRDVLARLLNGGRSVILIGLISTLVAYLVGVLTGIYAGYRAGIRDMLTMRTVDLFLAFPPLLVLLVLVASGGEHIWVLVVGVIAVQAPPIARLTRTASLSVKQMPYVEGAQARGDSTLTIWRKDVFPNILPPLLADFGLRFAISIILIASMNYLGLGLQPPTADWALMMSENRVGITLNLWGVVAPAIALALLTVGANLVADAYLRAVTRSVRARDGRWRRLRRGPGGAATAASAVGGAGSAVAVEDDAR